MLPVALMGGEDHSQAFRRLVPYAPGSVVAAVGWQVGRYGIMFVRGHGPNPWSKLESSRPQSSAAPFMAGALDLQRVTRSRFGAFCVARDRPLLSACRRGPQADERLADAFHRAVPAVTCRPSAVRLPTGFMRSSTTATGLWRAEIPSASGITRRGNDWSDRFPLVVQAVNHLKGGPA